MAPVPRDNGPRRLKATISDDLSTGSDLEERKLLALKDRNATTNGRTESKVAAPGVGDPPVPETSIDDVPLIPDKIIHTDAPSTLSTENYVPFRPFNVTAPGSGRTQMIHAAHTAPRPPMDPYEIPSYDLPGFDQRGVSWPHSTARGLIPKHALEYTDIVPVDPLTSKPSNHSPRSKIDSLQEQIKALQDELRHLENDKQENTLRSYHILYRIDGRAYFDPPEWAPRHSDVISRVPVGNLDLFLERNKSIQFIVYRSFSSHERPENATDCDRPIHWEESIYAVGKTLRDGLETFLQNDLRYKPFLKRFRDTGELPAPYLFIYHTRTSWTDHLAIVGELAYEQLTILRRYVLDKYGPEYETVDALFARRKVSVTSIKYLIRPGDILVSQERGSPKGLMADSWPSDSYPRLSIAHNVSRAPGGRAKVDRHVPRVVKDRATDLDTDDITEKQLPEHCVHGFQLWSNASSPTGAVDVVSRKFCIETSDWIFDGVFRKRRLHVQLDIPQNADDTATGAMEWDMDELNLYPLKFASESVVSALEQRGRMFWNCRRRHLVSYEEHISDITDTDVPAEACDRFMVDVRTFRKLHPENKSYSKYEGTQVKTMTAEEMDADEPPGESFVYLVPTHIKGFNLRTKKWMDLHVDHIHPAVWNKTAFDTLVLEKKTKELITALVSKQISPAKSTDVIAGKGNGLILLLHGGPGTGKTLTAEGVAEIAKKPLYRVTCGDVGTKAEEVEQYLESVLNLAKIWDCVVLLDEAEVFLERRSLDDLQRNALVSVFLRVIEYHEGILILTSNRVGTFDEAFRSRIQIAVHYPPLRAFQREQIWRNFFKRLESFEDGTVDVDNLSDHLEDLREIQINGRQIRNAITTARQYADWKGEVMNYTHLKIALEVAGKFDEYSEKLRGGLTDDQIAEEEGIR